MAGVPLRVAGPGRHAGVAFRGCAKFPARRGRLQSVCGVDWPGVKDGRAHRMTYRGTFRNGVVVFEEPLPLREGTHVEVAVADAAAADPAAVDLPQPGRDAPRGSARAILGADVKWAGPPEELDRLLDEVRRMRD